MSQVLMNELTIAEREAAWHWFYSTLPKPTQDLRVWGFIRSNPGLTAKEVAAQLKLSCPVVSQCLLRLHRRELISRMPSNHAQRFRYWCPTSEQQA